MTRLISAFVAMLLFCLPVMAEARSQASLNGEWRFKREDVKTAERPEFEDKDWLKTTLPHSFNAGDGDDGGTYYRGPVWYRKTLELKALPSSERLFLQFDGAALVADVFVNGTLAGRHEGGYATFRFDISRLVKTGKNVIAVKVSNAAWPHVSPLGGDFTVYGGLYRGVSLIQTRDAGIDLLDHGSPGVAVTSELVNTQADLTIAVSLRNNRARSSRLTVRTRVFDARSQQVLSVNKVVALKAGEARKQELTGRLVNPHLWEGRKNPYIYSVVTEIADDNGVLDRIVTPFGVRSIAFDAQKGLLLNGKPYEVVGVNLHASRAGKGGAISDMDIVEDFNLLEELGVTAVRLVHYQHAQTAYDEADRRGILILTEAPLNSNVADTAFFRTNAAQQTREMIRQNINHPSIIAWGLGNEIYATEPFIARSLKALHDIAIAEDPTRPTIYAHCCQADDDPKAVQSSLIGFNRYFGWYKDEFAQMGVWADGFHARFPNKPFAVLEFGAGGSLSQQQVLPTRVDPPSGWHPEPYQALFHEGNWAELKTRPFIWGKFVWQAFDAASDGRNEGERAGINDKGLISYDRKTKKDAFYFYKAQWSKVPFVHITSRRFDERTQARTDVKVYTNQPSVSLKVNGVVIATQNASGGMVIFKNITLSPGLNAVVATSALTKGEVSDRATWNLKTPVSVLVTPDRP